MLFQDTFRFKSTTWLFTLRCGILAQYAVEIKPLKILNKFIMYFQNINSCVHFCVPLSMGQVLYREPFDAHIPVHLLLDYM